MKLLDYQIILKDINYQIRKLKNNTDKESKEIIKHYNNFKKEYQFKVNKLVERSKD